MEVRKCSAELGSVRVNEVGPLCRLHHKPFCSTTDGAFCLVQASRSFRVLDIFAITPVLRTGCLTSGQARAFKEPPRALGLKTCVHKRPGRHLCSTGAGLPVVSRLVFPIAPQGKSKSVRFRVSSFYLGASAAVAQDGSGAPQAPYCNCRWGF